MVDEDTTTARLRQIESPLELLLEALRLDVELWLSVSAAALDRVDDADLPVLVDAVGRHLPARGADELGLLLLLQAPELMEQHRHRLSEEHAYLWQEKRWDGDRDLALLPAHHLAMADGVVHTAPVSGWAALAAPSPTWHPRTPAAGEGRIGGEASGRCPGCGWQLQRLLGLGTFPAADDHDLPRELVTCVASTCLWGEQFFDHTDADPRPLDRPARPPSDGEPMPQVLPVIPVAFHPAPDRWQLQDWMWSNHTQNLNRLGGAGSWVQDALHPACPGCSRPVPLLAQVDGSTPFSQTHGWERWTEGMIYAFWCRDCRLSAVTTQQT